MLSYDMTARGETSRYEYLYRCIRADIVAGRITEGDRLPSKRRLAEHLGLGVVTVEAAYAQLEAEGYVRAEPRRGYFVERLPRGQVRGTGSFVGGAGASGMPLAGPGASTLARRGELSGRAATAGRGTGVQAPAGPLAGLPAPASPARPLLADLSRPGTGASAEVGAFWTRALRSCIAHERYEDLFGPQPAWGNERLRRAIAAYLRGARGMDVDPACIYVGAGAQVLYSMVVKLLGSGPAFAVEDPGAPGLAALYEGAGARVAYVPVDAEGMSAAALAASGAAVAHVTPSHQFPTGRPMTVARRYELLGWACEAPDRMIVEDDYDWEFRFAGMPIPALASIDATGRVIYLSTFSKSLSSALRMAYMAVPPRMAGELSARAGYMSNTLSVIDQVTLARTLESGAYERHVARWRKQQRTVRDALVAALDAELGGAVAIEEADSGLHFVMAIDAPASEAEIAERALEGGVKLAGLSSYRHQAPAPDERPRFVVQYAGLDAADATAVARAISRAV